MNFHTSLADIRMGLYSAEYFNRTKHILENTKGIPDVTMQVFQKNDAVLCGVQESLELLKSATGHWTDDDKAKRIYSDYSHLRALAHTNFEPQIKYSDLRELSSMEVHLDSLWESAWDEIEIDALQDGDLIGPWESVIHIRGPLKEFAHLESLYLGILARSTRVATNTRRVVEAANGKPVLFFADRFDGYENQERDGYAASVGGASAFATPAMNARLGTKATGTTPHALIAAFGGNTVAACEAFKIEYPDVPLIGLVDFQNSCVQTSLECLQAFGQDLAAVRLDTSEKLIDASCQYLSWDGEGLNGVSKYLVENVRYALDKAGGQHVKIIVSGGFTPEKIQKFEEEGVPVDSYGVGSSLLQGGSYDFTADVTQPCAKVGRQFNKNDRMINVK